MTDSNLSRQQRRKQAREAEKQQHQALVQRKVNDKIQPYEREINRQAVQTMDKVNRITNALIEAQDQMMHTINEIATLAGLATVLEQGSLVDLLIVLRDKLKDQHDQVFSVLDQFGYFGGKPPSSKGLNRANAWIAAINRALDSQQSDFDGGVALIELIKTYSPIVGMAIARSKDDFETILEATRDRAADEKQKEENEKRANKRGPLVEAAKQALSDFRKNKGHPDWSIEDLLAQYLKEADSSTKVYDHIKTRTLKTIQNWGV